MGDARLSQLPVDVLRQEPNAPSLRLSQLPVDVLWVESSPVPMQQWRPTFPDRVPRARLPVACLQYAFYPEPLLNGPGNVTQVVMEVAVADVDPNQARVTHVLWEIIIIRGQPLPDGTACPPGFAPDAVTGGHGCAAPEFP